MNQKLTLSIEQDAIERGKTFAKLNGRSLSAVVEDFLFLLGDEPTKDASIPVSSKLSSLVGIGAGPFDEADYRTHLMKKHDD